MGMTSGILGSEARNLCRYREPVDDLHRVQRHGHSHEGVEKLAHRRRVCHHQKDLAGQHWVVLDKARELIRRDACAMVRKD
jgi:hypothetical protein